MSLLSLGLLASWPQNMLSASMDDNLLLLGQVSAQPSHNNSDRSFTIDPVTDLVNPVLSPVHSVCSWVLPGEITSKCKAVAILPDDGLPQEVASFKPKAQ